PVPGPAEEPELDKAPWTRVERRGGMVMVGPGGTQDGSARGGTGMSPPPVCPRLPVGRGDPKYPLQGGHRRGQGPPGWFQGHDGDMLGGGQGPKYPPPGHAGGVQGPKYPPPGHAGGGQGPKYPPRDTLCGGTRPQIPPPGHAGGGTRPQVPPQDM
uniref:Uncharacterized protein n=1 Tax=Apteryx owenii TaxID=8824 RepID=A0A8B9P0T2_APTOW